MIEQPCRRACVAAFAFVAFAVSAAGQGSIVPECTADTLLPGGPSLCRAPGSDSASFMIVRPAQAAENPRPLLYLLGGPGLYPDRQFPRFLEMANRWNRLVLVAIPPGLSPEERQALDCPPALRPRLWEPASTAEAAPRMAADPAPAVMSCLDHLGSMKVKAAAYSSTAAASRIAGGLQALDTGTVDVIAESYGARLAYLLAATSSGLVRSIVLDSPETLWADGFLHTGRNLAQALDTLSEACGRNRKCPTQGRRMAEKLFARLAAFDQQAAPAMRLRDERSGENLGYVRPSSAHLALRLIPALASPVEAGYLPFLAASRSDADLQRRFSPLISGFVLDDSPALSFALHHLIRCTEWPLGDWYEALAADAAALPSLKPMLDYLAARQRLICRRLDLSPPEAVEPPALGQVPTLVLSGTLDPVTPASTVARAFAGMEAVRRLVYENAGHVTQLAGPCVLEDIEEFFRSPDTEAVTRCQKGDLKIPFYQPIEILR